MQQGSPFARQTSRQYLPQLGPIVAVIAAGLNRGSIRVFLAVRVLGSSASRGMRLRAGRSLFIGILLVSGPALEQPGFT
jgi:hypothetical protein